MPPRVLTAVQDALARLKAAPLTIAHMANFAAHTPRRLGQVIDDALRRESSDAHILKCGAYTLNTRRLSFHKTNTTPAKTAITLTEKEVDILKLLMGAGGAVSRKALLDGVWGYADSVETHTLETHIYRLRQKIEDDPARPNILITDDTGYRLNANF